MPQLPYEIDAAVIRRFDARHTAFALAGRRRSPGASARDASGHAAAEFPSQGPSRDRLLVAEKIASRTVHRHFHGAFSDSKLGESGQEPWTPPPRYEFPGPEEASANVKAVARRLGGCLVGTTRVNPLWLYSHDSGGRPVELPRGVEFAVVIAVEMDPEAIRRSPGPAASAATGRAYSAMAVAASSTAEYIRLLGHRAISCGNGTALSIPLAVDAGLGVMGRNGLLLTREYGPFVRLCKVFTDLPLVPPSFAKATDGLALRSFSEGGPDEPQQSCAGELCSKCRRCAKACPVGAVSDAPEPSFEVRGISNNPGVLRWPVDAERCLRFWRENGSDCSSCVAACRYGAV